MAPSRAGEAIIRLVVAQRLLPRPQTVTPIAQLCRGQRQPARVFTTTRCCREEPVDTPSSSSIPNDISTLLDSTLDLTKGTPTTAASRNSHFKSRDNQQDAGSGGIANELERARSGNQARAVDELLLGLVSKHTRSERKRASMRYTSADISDMFGGPNVQPDLTKDVEPVNLPPNVGRLVEVDEKRNMDVGRAFRTMEMQCNKNRVKRSFAQQRFHERPGLKRKRLKHERWTKRFKENFKGTVKMVQKMKRQGW